MKYLVAPWQHQLEAIARAEKTRNFALFFEMGCLSHDAVVKVNRGGCLREYTIEQLYRLFNRTELKANERGFPSGSESFIRSWKGELLGLHKISKVVRSGEQFVFRLRVKGFKPLKLTRDHEVLTKRGWVQAQNLKIGKDWVAIDTLRRYQKKKDKQPPKRKPKYPCVEVGFYHPYAHETTGYKGKKIRRIEKHRAIFEAHSNGLSVKEFQKATFSFNTLGYIDPKKYHIHHIDHNPKNNDIKNLDCLTAKDHLSHHCLGYINFGHGALAFAKVKGFEAVGVEVTYDIVCEDPWRNFVANGIVVHNSGKTGTLINILRSKYYGTSRVLRTLVLCPPIVIENWHKEFGLHSKLQDKVVRLYGSGKERVATFNKEVLPLDDIPFGPVKERRNVIVVTNFESLSMKELYPLIEAWQPEILVVDEAHRCKNPSAKRTKATIKLADKALHRYILTGTPILNSLMDLFALFRILDGGETFGQNFYAFRASYFYDKNARMPKARYFPNWEPLPNAAERLSEAISKISMYKTKAECLDLPPLIKKEFYVELSAEQRRIYNDLKKDFVAYVASDTCVVQLAITKALRLMEIVSGYVSLETPEGEIKKKRLQTPRAEALKDLLEEITAHSKCLVWAVWKENYETIREVCNDLGTGFVEVHGEVTTKDKFANIERFNTDPNCRVLIGHPGSGGIGVNLVAASYSIIYSRSFSLEQELQAESRNHRAGSEIHEKITHISLIAKDTIDELVTKKLAFKQGISDKVLKDLAKEL